MDPFFFFLQFFMLSPPLVCLLGLWCKCSCGFLRGVYAISCTQLIHHSPPRYSKNSNAAWVAQPFAFHEVPERDPEHQCVTNSTLLQWMQPFLPCSRIRQRAEILTFTYAVVKPETRAGVTPLRTHHRSYGGSVSGVILGTRICPSLQLIVLNCS